MATELGGGFYSFDVVFDKGVAGLKSVDRAVDSTNKNLKGLDTQATATAKGVNRAFTQNIQNASFQVQDFAVQIASGQSAMVAFTQQLPQLIGGFGLLGAGIATAVAVFGGLYLAFGDAATSAEKLEKAIEGVQAVITVGSGQVANYTEEMRRLAGLSETLAKLRLATTIAEQNKAIELSVTGIREAIDDTRGSFDSYTDQIENLLGVQVGTNGYAAAEKAFRSYSSAIAGFVASGDVEGLEASLLALSDAGAANTKVGRNLIAQTVDLIQKYREGQIAVEALKSGLEDIKEVTVSAESSFNNFTQSLTTQEIALTLGERAAFAYSLSLKGLTSEQYNATLASYDRVKALESEKDAQESLNRELDAYFDAESRRSTQESNKANQFADRIVQRGMSESELFAQELSQLTELREQGLISQQKYDQAIVASVQNRNAQIERSNQQQLQNQALFTQSQGQLLGSLNNLFGTFANATDARDRKSFEKKKKFQTAQALINTAMAISNALAAAPPPINFALAGAAGAAGAVQVAAIQNQQFSGGRQFGGGVSQGSAYRVGEGNMPELYRSPNGQLGMIPGDNGRVIPMDKMGGSQTKVEIYNYSGAQVKQSQSDDGRITRVVIGEISRQISTGNGPIPKAMRANTDTRFQGNR